MEAVLDKKAEEFHSPITLAKNGVVYIDMNRARAFRVVGLTSNGEIKEYLLRVSDSGKLSLV
jgi:hypothetical protein